MDLAIIIPTYNERENLEALVDQLLALDFDVEIIVVDDNSPDGTGQLADALAQRDTRVHVIHRPGKLGLGTAYIAGFKYALARGAERIMTMDADFSHHPCYVPAVVALTECYDVGIGSRYVPGGGVDATWGVHRRWLSRGANLFARMVLGLKAHDCTAGFRCYRREVLQNIELDRIFSNGYSFLIELMFRCQRLGYTFGETPILFENRRQGSSKISQAEIYKAMLTVLRLGVSRLLFWRSAERYGKRAPGTQSKCRSPIV
ncbi:MAG: polyprenol monophosphomannose synthase [Anaerolineae bacterium]|nr:polyprenol monophosphomannose synthase [Anaerolineae bacterium]MDW8070460.1 polyprenol monophosphomannose synthase [Anaerolineae bacterium]